MSRHYVPPPVILDLFPAHPSTARIVEEITEAHEKGESGIYLVKTASATGKSTKFPALLAKLGKVLVLHSGRHATWATCTYMASKNFEGGRLKPWVAMKTEGVEDGNLRGKVVAYMATAYTGFESNRTFDFEKAFLDRAMTLVFDDVHEKKQEMSEFLEALPGFLQNMRRPLQVVTMSSKLDIPWYEGFFEDHKRSCKVFDFGSTFTPF